MKAWIIKWRWIGEHAAVDRPIVAVLSARTSPETIRRYVEFFYLAQQSLDDQIGQARYNKPNPNPYPAQFVDNWQGAVTCGHNPFLEAFVADNVCVVTTQDGVEDLSFTRRRPPRHLGW